MRVYNRSVLMGSRVISNTVTFARVDAKATMSLIKKIKVRLKVYLD